MLKTIKRILGRYRAGSPAVLTVAESQSIRCLADGNGTMRAQAMQDYLAARGRGVTEGPEMAFMREVDSPVADPVLRHGLRRKLLENT